MESKILFCFFFFIVIMIISTCKIYCFFLLCFLLLFLKDKDSPCIQVSLSEKAKFRGISSECITISSSFVFFFTASCCGRRSRQWNITEYLINLNK